MLVHIESNIFRYLYYYIKYTNIMELKDKEIYEFYSKNLVFKDQKNHFDNQRYILSMHIKFNYYMILKTIKERILKMSCNNIQSIDIATENFKKKLFLNIDNINMKNRSFIIQDNYSQSYYSTADKQQICINGCVHICNYCHYCTCNCICIKDKNLIYILSDDLHYIN